MGLQSAKHCQSGLVAKRTGFFSFQSKAGNMIYLTDGVVVAATNKVVRIRWNLDPPFRTP